MRRLAALRRDTAALQGGDQRFVDGGAEVLAWRRESADDAAARRDQLRHAARSLAAALGAAPELLISSDPGRAPGPVGPRGLTLLPGEGVLLRL